MKKCSRCQTNKELSQFSKNRARYDGLCNYCKDCTRSHTLEWSKSPNGQSSRTKSYKRYSQTEGGKITRRLADHKRNKTDDRKTWFQEREKTEKRQEWKELYYQSEHYHAIARDKSRRRRELKRDLDSDFSKDDALVVHQRFGHRCFHCGAIDNLEIDHHYPLSLGHKLVLDNAVLLCGRCNRSKGNKTPEEFYTHDELKRLTLILEGLHA